MMPFLVEQDLQTAISRYNTVIAELRQMPDLLFDNLHSNPRSIEWIAFKGKIILEEMKDIIEISPLLHDISINSQRLSELIDNYENINSCGDHLNTDIQHFDPYECK
jgi:hypothetical protein